MVISSNSIMCSRIQESYWKQQPILLESTLCLQSTELSDRLQHFILISCSHQHKWLLKKKINVQKRCPATIVKLIKELLITFEKRLEWNSLCFYSRPPAGQQRCHVPMLTGPVLPYLRGTELLTSPGRITHPEYLQYLIKPYKEQAELCYLQHGIWNSFCY